MLQGPVSAVAAHQLGPRMNWRASLAFRQPEQDVMEIDDSIHGCFTISEPSLLELLRHPAVQRLKLVLQHGVTGLIDLTPRRVTRYEHSVGAMLVVRRLGGTVEEQAAALLHDVAHTALSHVADTAFGYIVHEVDKRVYLDTTSIPEILDRHFGDANRVLTEENYSLLEQDAPRLCADRLDYGLRDCHAFGYLSLEAVERVREQLVAVNGIICLRSVTEARTLAYAYMKADQLAWAASSHGVIYEMAAIVIRLAIDRGIITKVDLWKHGDASFWSLLVHCEDRDVREAARRVRKDVVITPMTPPTPTDAKPERRVFARSYSAKELIVMKPLKIRTIDPDILLPDGSTKTLSELDPCYREDRDRYVKTASGPKKFGVVVPDLPFDDAFLYR